MTTPTPQDGTHEGGAENAPEFARANGDNKEACRKINAAVADHVRKAVEEFRERAAEAAWSKCECGKNPVIYDECESVKLIRALPLELEDGKA